MACGLVGDKPSPEPMLEYYQFDPLEQTSVKYQSFKKKCIWKCRLRYDGHLAPISMCRSYLVHNKRGVCLPMNTLDEVSVLIRDEHPTAPRCLQHGNNYIDGWVQDCSISIANALEILQSCTKSSIYVCNLMQERRNSKCVNNGVTSLLHEAIGIVWLICVQYYSIIFRCYHLSVSNHRKVDCLFNRLLGAAKK